jgi:hypothetical protein
VTTVTPDVSELDVTPRGREYFYFIQPEIESRGHDIAGASTTIQSLMLLSHGMRRRTGVDGGFRTIAFLDSIDKLRRLHSAYVDAEEDLKLAALRTLHYGEDAAGQPRDACCGEPVGCHTFSTGECWWFAARDPNRAGASGLLAVGQPLQVAAQPISSATSGQVESLIKQSDTLFATSSLEVGYDDPDIALVYQHYAPQNLASFIQRKGRAGRGLDDRPITAVTLSLYSARDSYWFRRPDVMISPAGFETPLNPANHFVRRGQALAAMLDALARRQVHGQPVFEQSRVVPDALAEAGLFVESIFGTAFWREQSFDDVAAFWTKATQGVLLPDQIPKVRKLLDWVPDLLFGTINLPSVHVYAEGIAVREDISLVLPTVAPGNASRRWDPVTVYWREPRNGCAPWLSHQDYAAAEPVNLCVDSAGLLRELPTEARGILAELVPVICRPTRITLDKLGAMKGVFWQSDRACDPESGHITGVVPDGSKTGIKHETRATLRGFLLVQAKPEDARTLSCSGGPRWVQAIQAHVATATNSLNTTGLVISPVYWGSDCEVRIENANAEPISFSQIFVSPKSGKPLLHGYSLDTEGIRIQVDTHALDRFVQRVGAEIAENEAERRWYSAQYMRFLVESRAQNLGVNAYEARRGADLIVAAAGDPEARKSLVHLLAFWDPGRLAALMEDTRRRLLAQHPLLSERRVARTAEALAGEDFRRLVVESLDKLKSPSALNDHIRSAVLHALMLRMKESFVHFGRGDERRVLGHVKLSTQFDGFSDDVITLCEAGAYGDGTTRTVIEHASEMFQTWRDGGLAECPNADEDDVLRRLWAMPGQHDNWRALSPRDRGDMTQLADDLGVKAGLAPPSAALRILYGTETVGSERIALYDLAAEIEAIRTGLEARLHRMAHHWELTSAAVEQASSDPRSVLGRLLALYGRQSDATDVGALSPQARLADQVDRIGTRLCPDGCRACVHQSSDLMSDSLVEVSTSRRLLTRFLCESI